jgi:hypothetical protein
MAPSAAAMDRLYRPQALDTPVLVPRDGPIATLDPAGQGIYAARAGQPQLALPVPPVQAVPEPTEPIVQVVEAPLPEVILFARRPAWVRVRAADGTVLLEKILEQGERFVLPDSEVPPTLRAGNSGSVYFAVNGETFGPAGPGTSVAKNVVLSASALSETYAIADLGADPDLARMAELVIALTCRAARVRRTNRRVAPADWRTGKRCDRAASRVSYAKRKTTQGHRNVTQPDPPLAQH